MANLFDSVIDENSFDFTDELAQLLDTQETEAMPWTPQFDRSGDLNGKLRARGRLLGRAFGQSEIGSRDQNHDHNHDQSHSES